MTSMGIHRTALRSLVLALACTLLALQADVARAKCVMTQTCENPGNVPDYDDCIPEAHESPVDPKPMVGDKWPTVTGGGACTNASDCSGKGECSNGKCRCPNDGMVAGAHCELFAIQCPEYRESACCSWQQNEGMAENFKLLASVFGRNAAGGCDACAANLLNLWCTLVCSPRQDEFMAMARPWPSTTYKPDPMTGEDRVKVLELNVSLMTDYTCALYDTCKNTAMASMAEAMKSSLGFLNYQMHTGAVGHGEFVNLRFDKSNATALDHHVYKCDNYSEVTDSFSRLPRQAQLLPSIASPSEKKQCPCGSCRATCDAKRQGGGGGDHIHVVTDPISIWDGFNTTLVAAVYGAVGVVGFLWLWYKRD